MPPATKRLDHPDRCGEEHPPPQADPYNDRRCARVRGKLTTASYRHPAEAESRATSVSQHDRFHRGTGVSTEACGGLRQPTAAVAFSTGEQANKLPRSAA